MERTKTIDTQFGYIDLSEVKEVIVVTAATNIGRIRYPNVMPLTTLHSYLVVYSVKHQQFMKNRSDRSIEELQLRIQNFLQSNSRWQNLDADPTNLRSLTPNISSQPRSPRKSAK